MLFENAPPFAIYTLIGMLLCVLMYGVWSAFFKPPFGYVTMDGYKRGAVGE